MKIARSVGEILDTELPTDKSRYVGLGIKLESVYN